MQDVNGDKFKMRATILNCVCVMPARCIVISSMQFNGKNRRTLLITKNSGKRRTGC